METKETEKVKAKSGTAKILLLPSFKFVQHVSVNEKRRKTRTSSKQVKNRIFTDTLTSVEFQENEKLVQQSVIEIYEGILFKESFNFPPLRRFMKDFFFLWKQDEEKEIKILEQLI